MLTGVMITLKGDQAAGMEHTGLVVILPDDREESPFQSQLGRVFAKTPYGDRIPENQFGAA